MDQVLLMNLMTVGGGAVAIPAITIAGLLFWTGSRMWWVRFLACLPLLLFTHIGLVKLWLSPLTQTIWTTLFGASVENAPFFLMLLITGIPGLLYSKSRASGFHVSVLVFGGLLTWLVTAGPLVEGKVSQSVSYLIGFMVMLVFTAAWTQARAVARHVKKPHGALLHTEPVSNEGS